ncbi:MAG: alpha/beta hydrolase [Alphaproteobacteria bacterium]|nr:alpha/beta hydrolase [Alphaproteobacteria bacterium]
MITDWDDAYANGDHIAGAAAFPERWADQARDFRREQLGKGCTRLDLPYGPAARNVLDLFMPDRQPLGLAVFIHGGYWLDFDKSSWSHLARGPLDKGWAVALPSYSLAPGCSVARITAQIAEAVDHAATLVNGPIRLAGHSAGGHLAARMVCQNAPLSSGVQQRIAHVLSISGLHDLRPLERTSMGPKLFHAYGESARESPALLLPVPAAHVTCWVGSDERPEFLRQSELLANIWTGLGADTKLIHDPGRHHFDVIDGLADQHSRLTADFIGRTDP